VSRGAGTALALLVLAAPALGQEPPAPEGGQGEQQEKDEGKEQEGQGERQDPAPAPENQATQQSATPPAPAPADVASPLEPVPSEIGALAHPPHPAVVWPLASDAIALHLRGIAETHPAVAALEVLGRSAGGREILALRLGAREAAPDTQRPVLLLLDFQGAESAGPEAMLELAWKLAADFEHDERVRALLTRTTLVLAPAVDPDARASVAAGGASDAGRSPVRFERNFPSGWQPESVRPGSGRVPLARPETLAVARFLASLGGCAVMLGFTAPAPRGEPYAGAELPPADLAVFAKLGAALDLEGASALVPWFELGSRGGSVFDYAYQARGIYPLFFPLPAEEDLAAGRLGAFGAEIITRVERCLTLLPRVEITQEGLERLASDTWQLDVRIQNVGIVPTSSALARHREPLAGVNLHLEGAKLVATARKPSDGAAYTDASFQVRAPLSGGTLAGGEGRWLRLFLEAPSGAEVRVTTASLWAGSSSLALTLL
jgi:hypothetical protein